MAEQLETVENIRKQYIVVKIGNEQYGIDISYVDNIVRMQKITRVPRVQNFFKGIINLRGEIVPVMSLRIRMELEEDVFTNASIGIAVYDPVTKIGGLAHIMLPDSTKIRNNSNIAKFADTGIEELIRKSDGGRSFKGKVSGKNSRWSKNV